MELSYSYGRWVKPEKNANDQTQEGSKMKYEKTFKSEFGEIVELVKCPHCGYEIPVGVYDPADGYHKIDSYIPSACPGCGESLIEEDEK